MSTLLAGMDSADLRGWVTLGLSGVAAIGGMLAAVRKSLRKLIQEEIQPDIAEIKESLRETRSDLQQTRAELTLNSGRTVKDVINQINYRMNAIELHLKQLHFPWASNPYRPQHNDDEPHHHG